MPADARAELIFGLRQVETPLENARKASRYDSMLGSFLIGRDGMVEVHVEGKNPRYVKMQLSRRIKVRFIEEIVDANVIKGVLYLEK
jgi:hypothetical protein